MVANISLITHLYKTENRTHTLIRKISWILLNYEQGNIVKDICSFKGDTVTSEMGS